jgi:signal transduction histidine kinase
MGAYSFVPKPFTPQELRASIESVTKNLFLKRMTRQMRMEGKQNQYQFLSVLSHELKSPINAVEGYIRIMLEKQVGDSIDDYRTMLERSLERLKGMRTLILDLIDITRIETGKKARDVRNIDLYEIAKRVVDTVEPLAIQKSVKMHMDVQENTFIKADSHEMEIILNNFISNAVKYNKDGGEVFFSIKKTADNYVITVEDTGIGISEEEQKLLFQEFVRIKNPQTKNITGSGLGLSIAKKMVDLYHGTIEVQSTPGEGSIFTVKLPAN